MAHLHYLAARTLPAVLGAAGAVSVSSCGEALSPKELREFICVKNEALSADTHKIRLGFGYKNDTLGLPVASCLSICASIDGKNVSRPYTPVSTRDQVGFADFVIKKYPPRTDGKAGGLAAHLCALKPGESVKMKGPWKKLSYTANAYSHIGMVAGGTGITPMLQVLMEIVNNPEDKTKVTLVFANKSEDDILLRQTLDEMSAKHSNFDVVYTVDKPTGSWGGETGFVNAAMIKRTGLPAPGTPGGMTFICGPPPMMKSVCGPKDKKEQGEVGGVLSEMGYAPSEIYKF